jgi:predicted nucleic acid-binding protein
MRPDDSFQEIKSAELSEPPRIVVADTSPLNYLIQLGCDPLLSALYRRVITVPAVLTELIHIDAPAAVRSWAAQPPVWLEILPLQTQPDAELCLLDPGERDAIQLALEVNASTVLIDERKGRQEAQIRGLAIVGTFGVLIAAQRAGLVDAHEALDHLVNRTTFRITPQLRSTFLNAVETRRLENNF